MRTEDGAAARSSPRRLRTRAELRARPARGSTTRTTISAARSSILLALALGPALASSSARLAVLRARARDRLRPRVRAGAAVRLAPALVPPLLRQETDVGSNEFTATLFDLIRRGRYKSTPGDDREEDLGRPRVTRTVADLELTLRRRPTVPEPLRAAPSRRSSTPCIGDRRRAPVEFRDRIEDDRAERASASRASRRASTEAIDKSELVRRTRRRACSASALGVFGVAAVVLLWLGIDGFRPVAPRWSDVVLVALGACVDRQRGRARSSRSRACGSGAAASPGRARGRALGGVPPLPDRLPAPARGAARDARALGALPRLRDRLRDRRARAAGRQLHMPEELHDASTIYWISPNGDLGSGPTRSRSATLAPASARRWRRRSSGGGGGFSAAAEAEAAAAAGAGG